MPKVSVIIPVYKAEPYIERCVRTLFGQTLDDLEFIFVDDCSPDCSIEVMERVLDEYPDRKSQVKVIRHEVNQGVSSARQHGVDAATGEYIIHCDPDDWVELNMYELMYADIIKNEADLVWCDLFIESHAGSVIQHQNISPNSLQFLRQLCQGTTNGSVWNKLIKRNIIETYNIKFRDGLYMWEDVFFCIELLIHNIKMHYIPMPLYHYDRLINENSLVRVVNRNKSLRNIELYENIITLANQILFTSDFSTERQAIESIFLYRIFLYQTCSNKYFYHRYKHLSTSVKNTNALNYTQKKLLQLALHNMFRIAQLFHTVGSAIKHLKACLYER